MYQYRFTFLYSEEEKSHLRKLAAHHHRSQSDVIRMLLREAMSDLVNVVETEKKSEKGSNHEQPFTKG